MVKYSIAEGAAYDSWIELRVYDKTPLLPLCLTNEDFARTVTVRARAVKLKHTLSDSYLYIAVYTHLTMTV